MIDPDATDLDLAPEPWPSWLRPALAKLRLGHPLGISPLPDRRLAAALLIALESDGPAPEVIEAYGQVTLKWSSAATRRIGGVIVHSGKVLGYRFDDGRHAEGEEWELKVRLDRLRGLVAWVRGTCEGDLSKGI